MASRALLCLLLAGCAHADPRRFALAPPVLRDHDLDPVTLPCAGAAKCAPAPYESPFVWDAADSSVFRPATGFLRARRGGEATDVNALDEVPDSSWFQNRLGVRELTAEQVFQGYCAEGPTLSPIAPDGAWHVDRGKDNGANPGFRIVANGTKFMLKSDDGEGERATAATAIASRLYYAAGFWAPCDAVVYYRRSLLKVAPGLTVKGNSGAAKPFDEAALDRQLEKAQRRGVLLRGVASRWLPGEAIGPFTYAGTRDDDPGDLVPHEQRRALRGSKLMAAWLNHFDAREQNTMSTWLPEDPKHPGRGHVRHWIIDLGDCFGSQWENDQLSRRLGHAYFFDAGYIVQDFASLGIPQRPWDTARVRPGLEDFGYFSADRFDPTRWRAEYPMLPFSDMTEADGAWMARIIARFTPEHVAAAVRAGDLTEPAHVRYLTETLLARQHAILARYLAKISPLTDVSRQGDELCALDLAARTKTFSSFAYSATVQRAGGKPESAPVTIAADRVCAHVPTRVRSQAAPDAAERYVVVRLSNGTSAGPLEVHLYDLGNELRLVGLQRPPR